MEILMELVETETDDDPTTGPNRTQRRRLIRQWQQSRTRPRLRLERRRRQKAKNRAAGKRQRQARKANR